MIERGFIILFIALILSSGCITMAKEKTAELMATPEPTPTPYVIIETPEPTPTPTPEPTLSREQIMEQTGGLHMGTLLSFKRENVSGLKDLSTHVTVWGWRKMPLIHWRSVSWGKVFISGAGDGKEFLFVYLMSWSDEGSSRMWGIQPSQFVVQINETLYAPTGPGDEPLPEIRITEFDETKDFIGKEGLKPYGYVRKNDEGLETVEELGFLKAGLSNAWQGYNCYRIPAGTNIENVKVIVNLHDLADSHWWTLE